MSVTPVQSSGQLCMVYMFVGFEKRSGYVSVLISSQRFAFLVFPSTYLSPEY